MARPILVLDEVFAILETLKASPRLIEDFRLTAERILTMRPRVDVGDAITVASGFGHTSQRGNVELTVNDQVVQMDVKKAREVGLMLLEAAEAATSDEILSTLLARLGLGPEARGRALMDLREIRQGTRGTSWPS
jgi:hypothetical protein